MVGRVNRPIFALLPNVRRDHPNYLGLWVDNADGSPFCSAVKVNRAQTSRGRSWFERALHSRTTSAGDYQIGLTSEKREIVLAQPLLNAEGDVERILAVAIELDQLIYSPADLRAGRRAIERRGDRVLIIDGLPNRERLSAVSTKLWGKEEKESGRGKG